MKNTDVAQQVKPATQIQRTKKWPAIVLVAVACGLTIGACVEFSRIQQTSFNNLPLLEETTEIHEGLVSAEIEDAPRPHYGWDGAFARAELIDTRTGQILAPSLMSEESLSLNTQGVLWTAKLGCRVLMEKATFDAHRDSLAVRFERRSSPLLFNLLLVLACGMWCGAVAAGQWRRIAAALPAELPRVCFNEFRITCFVLLSLTAGLAFYPGHPMVHVTGDPANINSFAAAYSHPEVFAQDRLLGESSNYFWYTPLYVKFVQFFGWIGLHFETNRAFLAVATTLLGLFGFFRLFKAISQSDVYAFAAALGVWYLKCHFPPNEDWGAEIVLPRSVYASLMPWVLCLAINWRTAPLKWSVAAAASGLLFYVHPVSSPALTGAILTGFVIGGEGAAWRRLGWGVMAAVVAVLVMFPYTLTYAQKYTQTVTDDPETIALATEYARARFEPGFLDMGIFAKDFGKFLLVNVRYWPGFVAFACLLVFRWRSPAVRVLAGMSLGWGIVTFLIPAVDLTVANRLDRMPFQMDLVRNLRYADVLLLGTMGLALREFQASWNADWIWEFSLCSAASPFCHQIAVPRMLLALCGFFLLSYTGSFVHNTSTIGRMINQNVNILRGRPPLGKVSDNIEVLRIVQALRQPDEIVYGPVQMRQAYVPLAYTRKDLAILPYANPSATVDAWERLHAVDARLAWPASRSDVKEAAQILDADWVVLDRQDASPSLLSSPQIRFQNQSMLVLYTRQERSDVPKTSPIEPRPLQAGQERRLR